MPRDASGNYSLPAGNPVVTGTIIESVWANNTMTDVGNTLTDSLDRLGRGGMLAALRIFDGTAVAPGIGFTSETNTGLFRAAAGEIGVALQGNQTGTFSASTFSYATLTASKAAEPYLNLIDTSAAVNLKNYRLSVGAGQLELKRYDDAGATFQSYAQLLSGDLTVREQAAKATLYAEGTGVSDVPELDFRHPNAGPVDEKWGSILFRDGVMYVDRKSDLGLSVALCQIQTGNHAIRSGEVDNSANLRLTNTAQANPTRSTLNLTVNNVGVGYLAVGADEAGALDPSKGYLGVSLDDGGWCAYIPNTQTPEYKGGGTINAEGGLYDGGERVYSPQNEPGLGQTAQIVMTAANTPDTGYVWCDGAAYDGNNPLYTDLWNKIGNTYGGTGQSNFQVPNMNGRSPMGAGQGNTAEGGGLGTNRTPGQLVGAEQHTLSVSEMPSHSHGGASRNAVFVGADGVSNSCPTAETYTNTNPAGGGGAHNNVHPVAVVRFQIKL